MIAAFGMHVISDPVQPRAMSLDIMVAADRQGTGLFGELAGRAIAEAQDRGAQLVSVVANARAARAFERHMAWTNWSTLSDWTVASADVPEVQVRELRSAPTTPLTGPAHTFYPRTPATLHWRTGLNRRYTYTWLESGPPGRPTGWAAVKVFRDPVNGDGYGDIVGLFTTESVAEPLQAALGWFRSKGVAVAAIYPAGASESEAAQQLGFKPSERFRYFCGSTVDRPELNIGMLDVDVY